MFKKQVLIVEDNQINREMLVDILSEKYEVLEACNGCEAIDVLNKYKSSISIILLDIIMPVMDGYTFLDKIKDDSQLSLIPVIVLTESGRDNEEVSALMHGATDFIPKPYRPEVILHRIASLIKLRETSAIVNELKYDKLTGLFNKEFFYQNAKEIILLNPDKKYAIICSNIENFKVYNDTFGVLAGDKLLKCFADKFKKAIGKNGICGRYNADRFFGVIECLDWNKYNNDNMHIIPEISGILIRWGIYEIIDPQVSVEQMCDRAFLAADSIKGQYGKKFAVYDDVLRNNLLREKAITDTMKSALEDNQFCVYLQPKYRLADNQIVGAEALVRWNHPQWGFMSPNDFIPLFEKNGFIYNLDYYVWNTVCKLLTIWRQDGYKIVPISVNVSQVDSSIAFLEEIFVDLTKKYNIEPKYLHLEVTESAYSKNIKQLINTMNELRKIGFIVEMDDFGSGFASLNMLSQMIVDVLKLDMKFIKNETDKTIEESILSDIINMAHRKQMTVVAEGVETKQQVDRLKLVNCDYVQGYYFSKPLPVDEFIKLLNK
ncbi:MAG: EAL domain-containing protein [Anaeroplasma sp.]